MTLGSLLTKEIKNMIDSINPLNFKYNEDEINITEKNNNDKNNKKNDKSPDYQLGKTSPHPRSFIEKTWNSNTHD